MHSTMQARANVVTGLCVALVLTLALQVAAVLTVNNADFVTNGSPPADWSGTMSTALGEVATLFHSGIITQTLTATWTKGALYEISVLQKFVSGKVYINLSCTGTLHAFTYHMQ
eukprot:m.250614 g.250614  ORF g.250614 m.250614 type:complete len:114 (-) comp15441_c1_seq3:1365-1706(-)